MKAHETIIIRRALEQHQDLVILDQRQPEIVVSRSGAALTRGWGFIDGSLSEAANRAIATRISGKDFATSRQMFSAYNHAAGTYTRNTSGWFADLDLTCVSPWNSAWNDYRCGHTLVNSRVSIQPTHQVTAAPYSIRYVSQANEVVTANVTAKADILDEYGNSTDITISVHNAVDTAKIKPAVIPTEAALYSRLPRYVEGAEYPAEQSFEFGQPDPPADLVNTDRQIRVLGCHSSVAGVAPWDYPVTIARAAALGSCYSIDGETFSTEGVDGDSGKLVAIVANSRVYAMGHWQSAHAVIPWWHRLDRINAAIETLLPGAGQQLVGNELTEFAGYV